MQLINIHPDFRSSVFYSGHVEIGVPWNEENTVDMMSYRYSNDDPSSGRIGSSKKLMPSIGIRNMAALKIFYSNCLHHKLTRYGSIYDMHKISKIQKFCLQSWIHKLKSSFFPNFFLDLVEYSYLHIHHSISFFVHSTFLHDYKYPCTLFVLLLCLTEWWSQKVPLWGC